MKQFKFVMLHKFNDDVFSLQGGFLLCETEIITMIHVHVKHFDVKIHNKRVGQGSEEKVILTFFYPGIHSMSNRSSLCSNHVSDNISTDSKQRNVT
jgi:hypothetical protein